MEYKKLIQDICREENIKCQLLSKDWVFALTKNNVTRCISGYKFPLNDHGIGNVIDDKYAFYDLCVMQNIPIIKHHILWNKNHYYGKDTYELAQKYFEEYEHDIVLKPNNGTEGKDVIRVREEKNLKEKLDYLFQKNFSISLCPFYNIDNEYRLIVLDNEVRFCFEKKRLEVKGDGISSLKELLIKENPCYFQNKKWDEESEVILNKDETYLYDWHFNLSRGATATLITDEALKNRLISLALETVKKINARFVSIDIVKVKDTLMLMEVNSGVCINKVCNFLDKDLKITKQIYKDAINKMF